MQLQLQFSVKIQAPDILNKLFIRLKLIQPDNLKTRVFSVHLPQNFLMETPNQDMARFDMRLPKEQKKLFERAAILGGYRNLTDFIIATVQHKANEIIEEQEQIIASEKDKEVFFDALLNPTEPNENLISATKKYRKKVSE